MEDATASQGQIQVDNVRDGRVVGWAFDPGRPELALELEVLVGGQVVDRVTADQLRPDLAAHGMGDGRHGFVYHIPAQRSHTAHEFRLPGQSLAAARVNPARLPVVEDVLPLGYEAWNRWVRRVFTGVTRRWLARVAPRQVARLFGNTREFLAARYLAGHGLEIGALHNPLPVPAGAQVTYVDRLSNQELLRQYPELAETPLVPVGVVSDGETLEAVPDRSQDFVIASHFLEHTQNPILAVENMLRVLRPGGVLFVALPDKRYTFDAPRDLTEFSHLVRDYEEGPAVSRRGHFEDWCRLVDHAPPEELAAKVDGLLAKNYSIHFHVWDKDAMLAMFLAMHGQRGLPLEVEVMIVNLPEVLFILRKI
ncbi:MAG: class I SAM-dependent methyltransferase [Deltaproteobacteria bacterium]|nr:class I SAM-dependent methyltransferase [Deltaproteobacteria bacterium]